MSQAENLAGYVRSAYAGEAHHGAALAEILEGVDARTAATKPPGNAHSIWELVLHIANWEEILERRLSGEIIVWERDSPTDWPRVPDTSTTAWKAALERLERANTRLVSAIRRCSDVELLTSSPGRNDTREEMIMGMLQHSIYHAGQISVLKKLMAPAQH
jgi:uncharacterized damage-inducible protein DinB